MTHPSGKYWDQPAREAILLDDTHAIMTRASFAALLEYSGTIPTGCYEGKMWRRHDGIFAGRDPAKCPWLLCWYGPSEKPDHCSVNAREILLV